MEISTVVNSDGTVTIPAEIRELFGIQAVEAKRQRPVAQRLIDSGQPLSVCKTVIVEREWLIRAIAFADALHHASYHDCDEMASFDDRKFSRRTATLKLHPPVIIPN